jgi:3-hydroxybutyryl-CoA dehydrogenase
MQLDQIKVIGIVGAGIMASGIAERFAEAGYKVIQYNRSQEGIERSQKLIRLNQDTLIKNGVLTAEQAQLALEKIETTTDIKNLTSVDFLSESIVEKIEDKQDFFKQINNVCRSDAILTTNTSGLSITQIGSVVSNQARFVGMHWWNPPHIMPLVEVIKGDNSADEACQITIDLCRKIGKSPVFVKKDIPGFIGNRIQYALIRETLHLIQAGVADAEDIDTVIKMGPGARWALFGPIEVADMQGLDIINFISDYLLKELSDADRSPDFLRDKVAAGELGIKAGKGFYEYSEEKIRRLFEGRDRKLLEIFSLQKDL